MAQSRCTHKGDRAQIMVPVATVVYANLNRLAAIHETSITQLAADLLAVSTNHPELVREIHQAALLPPPTSPVSSPEGEHDEIRRTVFRVPRAVYDDIRRLAAERATKAGQVAADLLAIATGDRSAVRQLDEQVLPLAM